MWNQSDDVYFVEILSYVREFGEMHIQYIYIYVYVYVYVYVYIYVYVYVYINTSFLYFG